MREIGRRRLALVVLAVAGLACAATTPATYSVFTGEVDDEVTVGGGQEIAREYSIVDVPNDLTRTGPTDPEEPDQLPARGQIFVGAAAIVGPPTPLERPLTVEVSQRIDGVDTVLAHETGFGPVVFEPRAIASDGAGVTVRVVYNDPDPGSPSRPVAVTVRFVLAAADYERVGNQPTLETARRGDPSVGDLAVIRSAPFGTAADADQRTSLLGGVLVVAVIAGLLLGHRLREDDATARWLLAGIQVAVGALLAISAAALLHVTPGRHLPGEASGGGILAAVLAAAVAIGIVPPIARDGRWSVAANAAVLVIAPAALVHLLNGVAPSVLTVGLVALVAVTAGTTATVVAGFRDAAGDAGQRGREVAVLATHVPLVALLFLQPLGVIPVPLPQGDVVVAVGRVIALAGLGVGLVRWFDGVRAPLALADLWVCLVVAPLTLLSALYEPVPQPVANLVSLAMFGLAAAGFFASVRPRWTTEGAIGRRDLAATRLASRRTDRG